MKEDPSRFKEKGQRELALEGIKRQKTLINRQQT